MSLRLSLNLIAVGRFLLSVMGVGTILLCVVGFAQDSVPTSGTDPGGANTETTNPAAAGTGTSGTGTGLTDSQIGSGWQDDFEDASITSWSVAGANVPYHIRVHDRVTQNVYRGERAEHILLENREFTRVDSGTGLILLTHPAERALIHPDLVPTVKICSNQVGIRFSAQVVLPNSVDPKTGRPVTFLINGSVYNTENRWQELKIANLSTLVERGTQALRMELRTNIPTTSAWIENLVLTVGVSSTKRAELWIDDLSIPGYATSPDLVGEAFVVPLPWEQPSDSEDSQNETTSPTLEGMTPSGLLPPRQEVDGNGTPLQKMYDERIRRQGPDLFVDDQPFLPRVLQYQGEPLTFIKQLGFNTVWFTTPPTEELLRSASQLGLWVYMPPPVPVPTEEETEQELTNGRAADGISQPSDMYDGVLAWETGARLKTSDQRVVQAWAQRIRSADRRATRRLLMGEADLSFRGFTWTLDGLVYYHPLLGTEMEFATYRDWVKQRSAQTKPTSTFWVRLETQPDPTLRRQWAALDRQSAPDYFPYEMLELSVWNALATGTRGIIFSSNSRLDAQDADTKIRAMSLELINSWLAIAEPWIAIGQMTPQNGGSIPGSSAILYQRDRARMLLSMVTPDSGQNVLGQAAGLNVLFTIPGVPDTNRVYTVQPGRLQPEASRRIAGGCGIDFRDFGPTTMAMISAEPKLIAAAGERLTRRAERQLTLLRSLAEYRLTTTRNVAQRLNIQFENPTNRLQFEQGLGEAGTLLAQMRRRPIRWTDAESYQLPRRLQRALRLAEWSLWREVVVGQSSVVTNPGAQLFDSLPAYMVLSRRFERQGTSPTRTGLLPGGDFEHAEGFQQDGWKFYPSKVANLTNGAELHRDAAYQGTYGLRIFATPTKDPLQLDGNGTWTANSSQGEQLILDASLGPTVEVISPPVNVPTGTLVRISGWYRMSENASLGCAGLEISDSLGGPAMAMCVREKNDAWKRFVFHRVAIPTTGVDSAEVPVTLQFMYHGLGSVQIDSVTMELL